MKSHTFLLTVALGVVAVFASLVPGKADAATKSFSMTAQQYSFSPSSITVEEGDTVKLTITSADVDHGFAIDALGVNQVVPAGKSTTVTFTVDSTGTYDFYSSVYSGPGHDDMTGTVVVKSAGSVSDSGSDLSDSDTSEESADTTAPTISGISVSADDTGTATISWTTSEDAVGQVEYGEGSGNYIAATPEGSSTTSHTATLTGLTPDTTYYYRIKSTDGEGNLARSSESSFTTEEEEEESCDDLECSDGETCEEVDGEAQCVAEDESCEDLECSDDEQCEVVDGEAQCVEKDEAGESSVQVSSVETDVDTYGATSTQIQLTDGQAITLTGTADADAEIALEFCCATTRYTVQADGSGSWTFEGVPPLDVGDNYVKVYEKGTEGGELTIDFEVVSEGGASADTEEVSGETIEEDSSSSSSGWVVGIIVAGLAIVVFSGFMFMKQVRR